MRKQLQFVPFLLLLTPSVMFSQLPDGSIAPDWTHNDIFGNQYSLYDDYLEQGKMVVLKFSATWCGPCWNYMMTGHLDNFWEQYGPNGTDQAEVFYIESDQSTGLDDLYGQTPESQGNWVANINHPIIDLQVGENTDNQYQIAYYPTLYAVCSDGTVWELGQVPASEWGEFVTSCTLASEVSAISNADCYGEGMIELETSGGISPITYEWSNGDSGPTLENVGAGSYSVTVTEGNDKYIVLENLVITGQEEPISLASSEVENALCYGAPSGNISIQLQEGTPPFSYDWSNGAQSQNLSNVPADEYTVVATDNNGCTFEETFIVTEPDPIEAESELTPDYCNQSSGTITLSIEGGVGGYSISSSEGTISGNVIQNLPGGNVDVEIEDNNGCIWAESFDIEAVAEPNIFFSPDPVVTCPEPIIEVTGYVENGSTDYEFEWSTTDGHIVGDNDQASIEVDQPGEYTLLVYDLFTGCQATNSVDVASTIEIPVASAGSDEPISCEIQLIALDGSGDPSYIVSWSTVNGNIVSGANTYVPVVDQPGEYLMSILNPANSCTTTDEVIVINEINPASAAYSYQTSSLTMIGTNQSTGSNLTNYAWTFGDGNSSSEPSVVHTYATAGMYEVCLSVENGCGISQTCQTVEVTFVGSVISVEAAIGNVLCHGNATGSIVLQVNGGSGVYSYQWIGPEGATYNTDSIADVPAGTYQLIISDDVGNIFIGEYIITEPTVILIAGSTVLDNLCHGQSNGSIAVEMTGGVLPYLYSFNGGPTSPENSIAGLPGGSYVCVITDANGCSFVAGPYAIAEPDAITHEVALTSVRCFGESNGAVNLSIGGGVAPYTYLWNVGGITTPEIAQLGAGQYSCLVTDHNGCQQSVVVDVTQPDALQVLNIAVTDATNTEQNNGSISVVIAGGVAPYTVSWNNGATGESISGLLPGEYMYTINDANGCTWAASSPVIVSGLVATNNIDWSSHISIRPNPSNGNTTVVWEGLDVQQGKMTLVTAEGRKLVSREMNAGNGSWDLAELHLSAGVYIILAEFNNNTVPFKIVVME